jgi:phosphoglycolate phosphatase
MGRFNNILFDLDGTLIDPGRGIAGSIQFVLDRLGVGAPFDTTLRWYVGPPLTGIFRRLLPSDSGTDLIESAVSLYIERFTSHGAQESFVCREIPGLLAELRKSTQLFLVTSKNTAVAEQTLTAHSLRSLFDGVIGTEGDRRFTSKADAVDFILKEFNLNPETAAIIGDREHDVIAGKANGIYTIGVTYGYGSRRELLDVGADEICDSPSELCQLLRT